MKNRNSKVLILKYPQNTSDATNKCIYKEIEFELISENLENITEEIRGIVNDLYFENKKVDEVLNKTN